MTRAKSIRLDPGTSVGDGRFAVSGLLGDGSQATTYEAVDKQNGTLVALKRFSLQSAESWKDVELAEREATVLEALEHPLLPRYVTHFEDDGALYLAMEKVEGQTLLALRSSGALSQDDVVRFLRDCAETLNYLHGRSPPIIHRDIKPSNVIRRPDGRYALVDFGSVRHQLKPEGGSTVVGTFGYMAPEQFQGRPLPASDVYSAAATALSLLTGQDPDRLPHKGLGLDVERALGPGIDPRLRTLLREALEPDPDRRSRRSLAALLDAHGLARPDVRREPSRGEARPPSQTPPREPPPFHFDAEPARRVHLRHDRQRSRHSHGFPLWWVGALFGLWVARIAVSAALLVIVPAVLMTLSVFFGPGLRRAARQTARAGRSTQHVLRTVSQRLRQSGPPGRADQRRAARPRVRVIDVDGVEVNEPKDRKRVFDVDEWEQQVEDLEREIEDEGRKARRAKR